MKTFREKVSEEKVMECLEEKGFAKYAIDFNKVIYSKNKVYALYLWENVTEYSETHKSHITIGFDIQPWFTNEV